MKDNSNNIDKSQTSNDAVYWGIYVSLIVVFYTLINRYLSKHICYHSWDVYSNIVLIFTMVGVLCIILYVLKILKSKDFLMMVVILPGLSIFPNGLWTKNIIEKWNERSIDVDSISMNCELSYFKGIAPGQKYNDVCNIMGEPIESVDMSDEYNSLYSMEYSTSEGSLLCYWDGNIFNNIEYVEFVPSYSMTLDDFLHGINLGKYNIRKNVYRVYVINHKKTIFEISLKNGLIRYIRYIDLMP